MSYWEGAQQARVNNQISICDTYGHLRTITDKQTTRPRYCTPKTSQSSVKYQKQGADQRIKHTAHPRRSSSPLPLPALTFADVYGHTRPGSNNKRCAGMGKRHKDSAGPLACCIHLMRPQAYGSEVRFSCNEWSTASSKALKCFKVTDCQMKVRSATSTPCV